MQTTISLWILLDIIYCLFLVSDCAVEPSAPLSLLRTATMKKKNIQYLKKYYCVKTFMKMVTSKQIE